MFFLLLGSCISASKEKCRSNYRADGCPICIVAPGFEGTVCGYCIGLNQCRDGTPEGPIGLDCPEGDWIYNKTTCSHEMCQMSKTESKCNSPCRWNAKGSICVLPRDMNYDTDEEKKQNAEVSMTQKMFLFALVFIVLIIIGSSIYSYFTDQKAFYSILPNNDAAVSLDNIPKP